MGAEGLKALYRRWLLEYWGGGDFAVAAEVLAEDLIDHNPAPGQPSGRAGDIWAARAIRKAFPDLTFTPDVIISDGEFVVGRWTMKGTNTGVFDLFNLPPTGRPVTMTGQEIFRGRDGHLVEVWHTEDVPGMLTQLGLQPPGMMIRLAARRSARRFRKEQRRS
jgi:predicted ester cyclase